MLRKVLIFGITGELGSRLAQLAVKAGHTVYGVSRGSNSRPGADITGTEVFTGDKLDRDFLSSLAQKIQPDAIIDTIPSVAMLDNIRTFFPQVKNVFIVSSTGTFVPLKTLPADETHPWEPTSVNFHGKIANDKYALELFEKYQFPVTIFRPTNIIGDGRIPLDLYGGRDVEFFRALAANKPLTLPDCREILLQPVCNWDLAKAMCLALTAAEDLRGEIITLSSSYAIRLIDYLDLIKKYLNSTSEITWADADDFYRQHPEHRGLPFLREHMCFSITKARRLLGYEPDYTPEQGLKKALQWCVENRMF